MAIFSPAEWRSMLSRCFDLSPCTRCSPLEYRHYFYESMCWILRDDVEHFSRSVRMFRTPPLAVESLVVMPINPQRLLTETLCLKARVKNNIINDNTDCRRRRNSWWKCLRPYLCLLCVHLWSRTRTFQFLVVVAGRFGEIFKVSPRDRVQQRLVEHGIFQQRLPSRSLTLLFRVVTELFILHRHLPVCLGTANQGGFQHFSPREKVRLWVALGVGTAPRVELIHAGGSAGGFLHGCSRCVDALSSRLVETSGLRSRSLAAWVKAGMGPSSCVSLRLLLEEFLRVFLSLVLAQFALGNWCIISFVLASGSHCSGCLGVACEYGNWIFREMTFSSVQYLA